MRGAHVRLVGLAVASAVVVSACGARTPLLVDMGCEGPTLPFETQTPALYFVLDHSLSMKQGDKWGQVGTVVASVMAKVGDRARFGVTIFPGADGVCGAGAEAMPLARGDNGSAAGPTVTKFLSVTSADPSGGTPTAATLQALSQRLVAEPNAVVVLATDGGPNCNDALACDEKTCVLNIEGLNGCVPNQAPNCCASSARNCLDDTRAEDAVSALRAIGVPTYVVGIPGSEVYGPVLDAMATRGGTARPGTPRYYAVASDQALAAALGEIADQVVKGCVLTLTKTPKMPDRAKVFVKGAERTRGAEWTLVGTRLELLGQTCADFDGDKTRVQVADGCIPTPR